MSKQLRSETPLAAPSERVVQLLTDPASLSQCFESAGFTNVAVATRTAGADLVVETQQDMTGALPGPLNKITGGSVHLTETHTWHSPGADGSRTADWRVEFHRVPGSIRGTIEVVPRGDGSAVVYSATVTAGIPVVGGRIESMTVEQTIGKVEAEGRWLAEHV